MPHVSINGNLTTADQAVISISERGFRYGDGVFETIPVRAARLYQWPFHLARLKTGLEAISIEADVGNIRAEIDQLLRVNALQEGFVRIYISRGTSARGYMPDIGAKPLVIIETVPHAFAPLPPCAIMFSNYQKISRHALPIESKLAQGLQSTLVALEASKHGMADGILLNEAGHITETSAANIFWLRGGTLYTPSLSCGVLSGSSRHALLRLSPYPVIEGTYTVADISAAEAVLLTSSSMLCRGVASIKDCGAFAASDALAQHLYALIINDIENYD